MPIAPIASRRGFNDPGMGVVSGKGEGGEVGTAGGVGAEAPAAPEGEAAASGVADVAGNIMSIRARAKFCAGMYEGSVDLLG